MIWLMIWLTCAGGACYQEIVEQEFPTRDACAYALAWHQEHLGVVGVCQAVPAE